MSWFKNYSNMIWLIGGIVAGSVVGVLLGKDAAVLKPIGDIFLNLLFVAVIPVVFFSISSAIANLQGGTQVSRILITMTAVFLLMVVMAALITMAAFWLFPVHEQMSFTAGTFKQDAGGKLTGDQVTQMFTTGEFYQLLSRKNMLAMIIFSILIGFGTLRSGDKGVAFREFLNAGAEVFKNVFIIIMKLGPIGLGAYFAYQVAVFGPSLFGTYAHVMGLGYGVSIFYFVVFYSIYAFIAGGIGGIKRYWQNNIIPSATAVGTSSSIATIPANLEAAKKMGISDTIAGIVIPLGAPYIKMAQAFHQF
ncbi:dicarboxylate/amino acid:cation symporter [Mucilaginibacter antarcticus]|uniref:dicarboxylate/amino acid:cation symporter n=1 Tax=Mucilaginibacter antarcticus TaxID=1855725 RepID=UPI00363F40D6